MRTACKSVPQSGSVSARPPRSSPLAKRGRKAAFCSGVPFLVTMKAMMRCELMMPVSDIHTDAMCSITLA